MCLFVHTKHCAKGRSIFSRSTEDGPAFPESPRVQPRSPQKCPALSWLTCPEDLKFLDDGVGGVA